MNLQIMPLADHGDLNNYCLTCTMVRIVCVINNNLSVIIGLKHKNSNCSLPLTNTFNGKGLKEKNFNIHTTINH